MGLFLWILSQTGELDPQLFSLHNFAFKFIPILVGSIAFILHIKFSNRKMDDVFDTGISLIARRGKLKTEIPYKDIYQIKLGVGSENMWNATIYTRIDTCFGRRLRFIPKKSGDVFIKRDKAVDELPEKIRNARN